MTEPLKQPAEEDIRQTVLFSGMDCLPGQLDLFETDGAAESEVDDIRAFPPPLVRTPGTNRGT
jgi:hypothetical protein